MSSKPEYTEPAFLDTCDEDTIHTEMLDAMPEDIDKGQGGFPWDFTRPTAFEVSKFGQFFLNEAIQCIFPMWAEDDILNYHALDRGLTRKPAEYAEVTITVTGEEGTVIPIGSEFATEATVDAESVSFLTEAEATIPAAGSVDILCKAEIAGTSGNVAAGTITLQMSEIDVGQVDTITNAAPGTGGLDTETDEALQDRCYLYDTEADVSFVGSVADYKRWALSVSGVGGVRVVPPADTSGLVTLVIMDVNGDPASQAVCTAVNSYIMGTGETDMNRRAPIGASLSVVTPASVSIAFAATVSLEEGYTITAVQAAFLASIQTYLKKSSEVVVYTKIGSLLADVKGVTDYSGLTINGGTVNVTIESSKIATTDSSKVVLTSA
ncbi:MAG: baseplate J/gp47 family protein [Eubacteriaceae bacterium]|nr:baseplate J/gp47 family protein [Eubacteriaceae bacterium]